VVRFERTRYKDGSPVQLSVNFLLPSVARRLPLEKLVSGSLSEMLSAELGIETTSATQTFTAVAASAEVVRALRVKPGAPVLFVETIGYSGQEVVNFTHVHYHPEHVFFTAVLRSVAADPRMARLQALRGNAVRSSSGG
jgi:GntR family transcriptional regulator